MNMPYKHVPKFLTQNQARELTNESTLSDGRTPKLGFANSKIPKMSIQYLPGVSLVNTLPDVSGSTHSKVRLPLGRHFQTPIETKRVNATPQHQPATPSPSSLDGATPDTKDCPNIGNARSLDQ